MIGVGSHQGLYHSIKVHHEKLKMKEDDEYSQTETVIVAITAVIGSLFIGAILFMAIDAWFS